MSRRIYPRPPIVEAVIQLHLSEEVRGSVLLDALSSLAERYPDNSHRQNRIEVTAQVQQSSVATSARMEPFVTFLRSSDGTRLVGCGDSVVSVHVLAPYPGWESFIDQAREAVSAIPQPIRRSGLKGIGVRYIDRIVLPAEPIPFSEYLMTFPPRPTSMPAELSAFRFGTHAIDSDNSTSVILTVASAPREPEDPPALIYDLDIQRTGTPLCSLLDARWIEIAEALHLRQRDIFEESITDRARELFQ